MFVRFVKTDKNAITPTRANVGDAGFDLVAINKVIERDYVEYDTGIAVEIPIGFVGLLFPRSSVSKYDLSLCNCVGVIDSGYRNSIRARFRSTKSGLYEARSYKVGDKIVQLIIIKLASVTFCEVDELDQSERGLAGFGSSGV